MPLHVRRPCTQKMGVAVTTIDSAKQQDEQARSDALFKDAQQVGGGHVRCVRPTFAAAAPPLSLVGPPHLAAAQPPLHCCHSHHCRTPRLQADKFFELLGWHHAQPPPQHGPPQAAPGPDPSADLLNKWARQLHASMPARVAAGLHLGLRGSPLRSLHCRLLQRTRRLPRSQPPGRSRARVRAARLQAAAPRVRHR